MPAMRGRCIYLEICLKSGSADDDPSDMADEVQRRLAELSASGTQLFIQHGNRDFFIESPVYAPYRGNFAARPACSKKIMADVYY